MSKAKYIWAWSDDEQTYINKASGFEEVAEEMIQYYDSEATHITINRHNGKFIVSYMTFADEFDSGWDEDFWQEEECGDIEDHIRVSCEFDANAWGATVFLNALARANNRQDRFEVTDNN